MSISNIFKDGEITATLPYFHATIAGGNLASGTTATNNYTTVVGTLADEFNAAAGVFTPSVSGLYMVSGVLSFNIGAGNTGDMAMSVSQGSNSVQYDADNYVGGQLHPTATGLLYLTAGGATIYNIYQTVGNPLPYTSIRFSACLVGR